MVVKLPKLQVFHTEGIWEEFSKFSNAPENFKFPHTIRSISVPSSILDSNFIPSLNEIDFEVYKNLNTWKITESFQLKKFLTNQPTITHLSIDDDQVIELATFNQILYNNPNITRFDYSFFKDEDTFEKLTAILKLPNLITLQLKYYMFFSETFIIPELEKNTAIKTLIITNFTPPNFIESFLSALPSVNQLILTYWNYSQLNSVNWINFKNQLKLIKLGHTHKYAINEPFREINYNNIKLEFNNNLIFI